MAIGTADLFTADYSSSLGNFFDELSSGAVSGGGIRHNEGRLAGGGPNGLDAYEIDFIPNDSLAEPTEPGLGRGVDDGNGGPVAPADGVARYYRWFEYHDPDNDYWVLGQASADAAVWRLKRFILGDGGGSRVILNTNCETTGERTPHIEIIFDGTPTVGRTSGTFSKGVWHAIQIEITYNSATASNLKLWLDNDTYASPDIDLDSSTTIANTNLDYFGIGRYSNHVLDASGTSMRVLDAGFRVATTFDSNWATWLQVGDGGDPEAGIGPCFLL